MKIMHMYIPDFPVLRIEHLAGKDRGRDVFQEFYEKEGTYFYNCRGALWKAIKLLHIGKPDKILVPAYHCGVEIEAILRSGAEVEFYEIGEDMSADMESLENGIKPGTKAVLVIHYYGFPQPIKEIKELCLSRNLCLIEDCAHALFSSHNAHALGTYGDISVFSQRKTLPIPDGGALLINNPEINTPINLKKPAAKAVLKNTLSGLLRPLREKSPHPALYFSLEMMKRGLNGFFPDQDGRYRGGMAFHASMGDIAISRLSRKIMDSTDSALVISRRRANFKYLLNGLRESERVKICFPSLPEGTCPLFFPVRVSAGSRRKFQELLLGRGIRTFVFGEYLHELLPQDLFSAARSLSREVLCLPIHQDLTGRQLDFMLETIKEFL